MKKGFNILMIFCAAVLILSCNKNKSYTDYLKDEKKAISRLFDEKGFIKLKEYPKDGVFKDKEYVELQNGVYLHVIDSGNGNRPVAGTSGSGGGTLILTRAKGFILPNDSNTFDGFKSTDMSASWPLEFQYGSTPNTTNNYFMSVGYASVTDHVGDSSYVSMIVPFRSGSNYQQSNYVAIYYERVRFTFAK